MSTTDDRVCAIYTFQNATVARIYSRSTYSREVDSDPFWWVWGEEWAKRHPGAGELLEVSMAELEVDT